MYVMLCMVAGSKKVCQRRKVSQRWRSEGRGESLGFDVSGDLDRDDWFPDLHQDAGRYPSHLLSHS